MTAVSPLLELHDVHVTFTAGKHARAGAPIARAVDGVDLAVERGEIVALVGESGCGKTTLARTILGLETAGARGDPLRRRGAPDVEQGPPRGTDVGRRWSSRTRPER